MPLQFTGKIDIAQFKKRFASITASTVSRNQMQNTRDQIEILTMMMNNPLAICYQIQPVVRESSWRINGD